LINDIEDWVIEFFNANIEVYNYCLKESVLKVLSYTRDKKNIPNQKKINNMEINELISLIDSTRKLRIRDKSLIKEPEYIIRDQTSNKLKKRKRIKKGNFPVDSTPKKK